MKVLDDIIASESFFELKMGQALSIREREKINQAVSSFYGSKMKLVEAKKAAANLKNFLRDPNFPRREIVHERLGKARVYEKKLEKRIKELEAYLEERTDWADYLKKREFAIHFRSGIAKMVFARNPLPRL